MIGKGSERTQNVAISRTILLLAGASPRINEVRTPGSKKAQRCVAFCDERLKVVGGGKYGGNPDRS